MGVEKRTGWDWEVYYIDGDEPVECMLVFGQMTIEGAIVDAHNNLSSCTLLGLEPDYQILGAHRADLNKENFIDDQG